MSTSFTWVCYLFTILAPSFASKHCNQYENQTLGSLVRHVVSVRVSNRHQCTGSIISANSVLTAAKCVLKKMNEIAPENITVVTEYYEEGAETRTINIFKVATLNIELPADATDKKEGIAILHLKTNIQEDGVYMERIPLSKEHMKVNQECVAFYWHKDYDNISIHVDFVELFVIPFTVCKEVRAYNTRYLCLGNPFDLVRLYRHQNTGGPLICAGKQQGIAIFLRQFDITSYYANVVFYQRTMKSGGVYVEINIFCFILVYISLEEFLVMS